MSFISIVLFNSLNHSGGCFFSILQLKKLRFRKVKQFIQSHTTTHIQNLEAYFCHKCLDN